MVDQLDKLGSRQITACQLCGGAHLAPTLFFGYLPSANTMLEMGSTPDPELDLHQRAVLAERSRDGDARILTPHSYPGLPELSDGS
jgi:hypothetical protein